MKTISKISVFTAFGLLLITAPTHAFSKAHREIASAVPASPDASECAIKTAVKYPTVPIRPERKAQDEAKGITGDYFTPEKRESSRIVIRNGQVYTNLCVLVGNLDDGDQFNYVMDAAGNFYWFDEKKTPTIRHSAVFSAGPVSGAGDMTIKDSKIVFIDSDSGHYPTGPVFQNVLTQLKLDGVVFDKTVTVTPDPENK